MASLKLKRFEGLLLLPRNSEYFRLLIYSVLLAFALNEQYCCYHIYIFTVAIIHPNHRKLFDIPIHIELEYNSLLLYCLIHSVRIQEKTDNIHVGPEIIIIIIIFVT